MDVTLQSILAQGSSVVPPATRRPILWANTALAALVVGVVAAGALVPIGGVVISRGTVTAESHVKRIAHPTGGVIAALYVRNGDRVAQGQALMRLEDAVSGSEASLAALTVDQLLAQRSRLEAEQVGAATLAAPPELAGRTDVGARRAIAFEARMFATRRDEQVRLAAQLAARIAQYRQQIAGLRAQIAATRRQMTLIEPERQGLDALWNKGLVTLNRRNQVERQAVDYEGQVASLRSQIAQVEAKISETREQLLQAEQSRRAEAGTQLAQLNVALNQQRQHSVGALDAQARTTLRAPYAGIVDKVAFTAIGDVVKPAETIMEIVPDRERKVVEARIDPADIDRVAVGRRAHIRFAALNRQSTPELMGTVITIGADRAVDPDGKGTYYAATIALDREPAIGHPEPLRLRSGMAADVYVESGSRSMLSFLLKPLRDQLGRAFRDNPS